MKSFEDKGCSVSWNPPPCDGSALVHCLWCDRYRLHDVLWIIHICHDVDSVQLWAIWSEYLVHDLLLRNIRCCWAALIRGRDNGDGLSLQEHRSPCRSTARPATSGVVSEVWRDESSHQQVLQRMRNAALNLLSRQGGQKPNCGRFHDRF